MGQTFMLLRTCTTASCHVDDTPWAQTAAGKTISAGFEQSDASGQGAFLTVHTLKEKHIFMDICRVVNESHGDVVLIHIVFVPSTATERHTTKGCSSISRHITVGRREDILSSTLLHGQRGRAASLSWRLFQRYVKLQSSTRRFSKMKF